MTIRLFLVATAVSCLLIEIRTEPLAEEIMSKDLGITNQQQFERKLISLLDQAKALLITKVTTASKKDAANIYTRLSTVLEVYNDRFSLSKKVKNDAITYLNDLSLKFSLQSPNPWIVPITDVLVEPTNKGTIADIIAFALADKQRPLTQTEAHLSQRHDVLYVLFRYFPEDQVIKNGYYSNLVKKIIQQERIMRDYYVFYHGQGNHFILFYDLIKEVFSRLEKKGIRSAFDYLRVPGQEEFNITLAEIIKQGFETDRAKELINILVSVNLSLFGNINMASAGESTFVFFIRNTNINPPPLLWESLFRSLKLNSSYINQAVDLLKYLKTPEGNLLQIFIPKNKVNNYVFLTRAFGLPLSTLNEQAPWLWIEPITITNGQGTKTYYLKTIDTATLLDIYRNYPENINVNILDEVQARILLTNDFLLNPDSGVQIYRYNTIPQENMRIYKQKLKELVDRMLSDQTQQEVMEPVVTTMEPVLTRT